MNDDSWQDLDPVEQMVLLHDKVLGVSDRYPGGASSGYIGDMSDGDDEDSDHNEESEEEVAAAADVWSRCVTRRPNPNLGKKRSTDQPLVQS
jgi:hypothetical protein